jgi:hypothetical protein
VLDDNRRRLEELARRLEDLLSGRSSGELADLVVLADGLTEVLLSEVAYARAQSGGDAAPRMDPG